MLLSCKSAVPESKLPNWPPQVGQKYADLELSNYDGKRIKLSEFAGKVILIEPVGMSCTACHAFSGAHKVGTLGGITPQAGLPSIAELVESYGATGALESKDLVFVQVLFYNNAMGVPTVEDAATWAKHFGFDKKPNYFVLVGTPELQNAETMKIIPGFQLVDRNFVLRYDSGGNAAPHNLYTELIPNIWTLLFEKVS